MTVIRISIYLLTFWFVFVMGGNMLPCKDSVESYICFNVETIQDYVHTSNPEPLPTKVNISLKDIGTKYHYGVCMYMVPLKKWAQYFPDSNFTSAISLCFKISFDEGPIFTILYWKAVQGLKHIFVVKNTSSERINSLYFILSKPFLAFRGH